MSANDDDGSGYYTSTLNKIGESHYRAKRHNKALEYFEKVLKADPDNDIARTYLQKITDGVRTVCFETSIWTSYMLGDHFSQNCKKLIKSHERSNDHIIFISHMIIAEVILTLRSKIMHPERRANKDDSGNPLKYKDVVRRRNKTHQMIGRFLNFLRRLSDKNKLVYYRKSIQLVDFENIVFNRVKNYGNWNLERRGHCDNCADEKIIENERCPECGNALSTSTVKYRKLDYADIQHAEMARLDHVQRFFTTDKSFRHLSSDRDFSHMKICVIDNHTRVPQRLEADWGQDQA